MQLNMKKILIVLFIIAQALLLHANVGSFGGYGESLRLVDNSDIQMVSEKVVITLVPSENPVTGDMKHKDEARYRCSFKLRNLTDKDLKVKVGFPIRNEGNFLARNASVDSYGFCAESKGRAFKVEYLKSDAEKKYSGIFLWEMAFFAHEVVDLEVSYRTYGYLGVGITQDKPYNFKLMQCAGLKDISFMSTAVSQYYGYVVSTGKSWAGEIESAEFVVDVGNFERYLAKRGYLAYDEKSPYAGKYAEKPFYNGALSRILSPSGWVREGDCMVLRRAPFDAAEDILIRYDFTIIPTSVDGLDRFWSYIESSAISKKLSREDRKNISDIILEFYGIKTGNEDISEFLKMQSWYKNKDRQYPALSKELRERLESYGR